MLELKERDVHFPIVENHVKAFQLSISAEFFPFPATEWSPLPGESKWLLIQHSSPLEILLFEMFQKKHCMVCFISFSSLRRSVVIETKRSCRYDHSGSRFSRSSLSELSTTTFHRRSHFPASKWYWLSSEHTAQN